MKKTLIAGFLALLPLFTYSQKAVGFVPAMVDFSETLQPWDGFGFNYVETCQTRDYNEDSQDYGGFSLLDKNQRQEIAKLVFHEEGLNVDIVKMFLDPWHQESPGEPFDHETTTANMLDFYKRGMKIDKKEGHHTDVITTLYGPPAWATEQQFIGARELDETKFPLLADYMIDWARYLRNEGVGVKYLSIHNEGEDFYRWDFEDETQRFERFDYNAYWRPEQVNSFVKILHKHVQSSNIQDLGVTNGEPSNWTRFYYWGYAHSLAGDDEAMDALGMITTHGFINGDPEKLSYATANSLTNDLLRARRPGLHSWTTSFAWGEMDTKFVRMVHENIYTAKVNAVIPWAGIQHGPSWYDGDPTGGTAIRVHDDGTYEVTRGYYFYKQLTQAGHRGMAVASATLANPRAFIIAFSGGDTPHPDAFVVTSYISIWKLPLQIQVKGTKYNRFKAYRTSEDGNETYDEIGIFEVQDGAIEYDPPWGTITTFIGIK